MITLLGALKAVTGPKGTLVQLAYRAAGPCQQSSSMHTALARSVVLPRLLDTLSTTFQQSSTRMDGLINHMTQELEKVSQLQCMIGSCRALGLGSVGQQAAVHLNAYIMIQHHGGVIDRQLSRHPQEPDV